MIVTNAIDELIFLKRLFEDEETTIYAIEDCTSNKVKINLSVILEKSDYLEIMNY